MSMETKAKYSPAYLRKRFDRMLERCAKHGDKEGNEAEIGDLRDFCELMFAEGSTLLAHCRNNLPRLLAAIKAERAAFSKTRFEVHAVPEGSTDEWLAARKETNAAVKMAEEVEA